MLARSIFFTLAGCAVLLLVSGVLLCVYDTHVLLANLDATVVQTRTDLHSTSQNVNAVLLQAGLAADQAQNAAREQRAAWAKNSVELGKTARAVRLLVDRTDRSLNDHTLPLLQSSITDIAWNTNQSLGALTGVVNDLDLRVNSPMLTDTLSHLNLTALHLDLATGNANSILAHTDHVASYYDKKLTAPMGFAKTLGSGLLHLIVPGSSLATAIK